MAGRSRAEIKLGAFPSKCDFFVYFLMGKPRSVGRGVKVFDFRMIFAGGGFEKTQATEREERCAASVFPAWPPGDHLASFVWLVLGAAWVLVICRVGA